MKAAFLRSTLELIEELRRPSRSGELVVCLDNFVRLEKMDVVEKLAALGITMILVSSVERDLRLLRSNTVSKPTRLLSLRNYSGGEAAAILRQRAQEGLVRGSFDEVLLRSIVASTDGNVTLGINVLRAGALRAEAGGNNKIQLKDIHGLLPRNQGDLELAEDERQIVRILREKGSVEQKQLYTLYCQSTAAPKQERTFRNYLQRLIAKSLIRVQFRENVRVYEAVVDG